MSIITEEHPTQDEITRLAEMLHSKGKAINLDFTNRETSTLQIVEFNHSAEINKPCKIIFATESITEIKDQSGSPALAMD